ncbi:aldehyde dehydrogenase family protein, partial [Mesorhizobium sp. M00.F.Ca.ET.186.01.1.1]
MVTTTTTRFNQGQVCCAGSRLLVQEGIAEAFIAKVK